MKAWVPVLALGLALLPLTLVHPVKVQGRSMEPTLRGGSLCWVLRAWAAGTPGREEVWLVESLDGPALKRVLALPGERLEMKDGELFQFGRRLEEPYVDRVEQSSAGPWEAGGGYLLLGDNRPESRDSRSWGPLPKEAFRGRVLGLRSFRSARPGPG
jgi:signal peptidase I